MTIEWMEYPVSLGDTEEEMTITWRDGTTDRVPAHDGDGETIYQLPRLMNTVFEIRNFNCFVGQSGKFVDEYPALFQSENGVLVLRVSSEESFMNAFICKSRDSVECLLSWMNGDIRDWLDPNEYPPEGASDFHWVRVREILAFIGSGLLDDFAPIIFDPDRDRFRGGEMFQDVGLVTVELPWWNPPAREGPDFAYPACLFLPETYEREPDLKNLDNPSIAVSVSQRLSQDEWVRLLKGSMEGSIAQKIDLNLEGYRDRFDRVSRAALDLGELWLDRWSNFF